MGKRVKGTDGWMPTLLRLAIACGLAATGCRAAPSTPLTKAAYAGDVASARALLTATAADSSADGWTPLVWATRAGRVEVMALLLDAGADPNRPDEPRGWTPLMHALHVRQSRAAELLLARGADGTKGSPGNSPLQMATLDNDLAMMRRLLALRPPRVQQLRAFRVAVTGGVFADVDRPLFGGCQLDAVQLLLAADRSLAHNGGDGIGSPIWWARQKGCDDVIAAVESASVRNWAEKRP